MKSPNPLFSPGIRRYSAFLLIVILPILISACSDPAEPEQQITNGLAGRIVDSSGVALDSVNIYCYYSYYPASNSGPYFEASLPKRLNKTVGLDFTFFRNYPNPVYNSTYIKFALPGKSHIGISVTRSSETKASYVYSDDYQGGLYQYKLNNIVEDQKLKNGPYIISFSALSDSGKQFNASCSMFVVSDLGTPNAAANSRGEYYLPFSEAFVGDSVFVSNSDYTEYYKSFLGNYVYLFVKRRGYRPLVMQVALFRNLLLHQDIVLYKEGNR